MKKIKKDAEWALRQIEQHLPFEGTNYCECSADLVYYIAQVRRELKRTTNDKSKRFPYIH